MTDPVVAADRLNRLLNSFATQSFRDQADQDYIAARLACRAQLFSQFLWQSLNPSSPLFNVPDLANQGTFKTFVPGKTK